MQKDFGRSNIVSRTFIVMNVVPIATTIATTTWVMRSDNCPLDPQRECKPLSDIGLDRSHDRETRTVRPWSRLLLATRGQSGWLFEPQAVYSVSRKVFPLTEPPVGVA